MCATVREATAGDANAREMVAGGAAFQLTLGNRDQLHQGGCGQLHDVVENVGQLAAGQESRQIECVAGLDPGADAGVEPVDGAMNSRQSLPHRHDERPVECLALQQTLEGAEQHRTPHLVALELTP